MFCYLHAKLVANLIFVYLYNSMNGFVGDGITRDGLELVGERYGVCYVMCTSSFWFFIFDVWH